MFSRNLIGAALAALFLSGAASAQVNNPGIQQSGAVTAGHCTQWGPGVGQISDAGQACGAGGGGTPGGVNGNVQFNNAGAFGGLTDIQLTARIQTATNLLSGALPAWPNTVTTYFRGDGTYATLNCAALSGVAASCSTDTTNASNIASGTLSLSRLALASANIYVGTAGNIPAAVAMSGDCTIANTGVITCTKTNNVSFAASATTDTTNATNIGSGTLNTARLPAPFTSGTRQGNTSAFVTFAGAAPTTGHFATWDANGNVQDGGTAVTIANGGTGITNLIGEAQGFQPFKQSASVIGVNPGHWANNTGTQLFVSTSVLTADLTTQTVNFAATPAVGGQMSGQLDGAGTTTDKAEVFLYLIHRNSDGKLALIGDSNDVQSASQTFTATATAPGVITTASPHGLRRGMPVFVTNSGGALPAPLGSGISYYACGASGSTLTATTFGLATSINSALTNSCLTFTTTGSGTNTASWGVQNDLDFRLGAGVATFDRRVPWLAFTWNRGAYGAGIPDVTVPQNGTFALLTGASNTSGYQVLNAGAAAGFTDVDLSPWLANINRRVMLYPVCTTGPCTVVAKGSGGSGFPVVTGAPITLATDSSTVIQYKVTAGSLSLYLMGWWDMDPS